MGRISQLFNELKRRNVFRAGAAYLVLAWLVVQVADILLETYAAPEWVMQTLVTALAIGFPIALVLSWLYEITVSGIKRTDDVDVGESITSHTGRKLDFLIIGVLSVTLVMLIFDRLNTTDVTTESNQRAGVSTISVGVLPFELATASIGSHFQQLSGEISRLLSRSERLHVISADAIAELPSTGSLDQFASQLGARYLVSGLLSVASGNLNLRLQVYDGQDEESVLQQEYQEVHLPHVQRQVAAGIAALVGDSSFEAPDVTIDAEAFDKYLRARQLIAERTEAALDEAEQLLNEAIQLNGRFASAYATICRIYLWRYGASREPTNFSTAEQNCLRAWTLDSDSPDVLFTLAQLSFTSGQFEKARDYADATLRINPDHFEAQLLLATANSRENPEIAELQLKSIIAKNPGSPAAYDRLQRLYFRTGRAEESIEIQRRVVRLLPQNLRAKETLSSNLLLAGQFESARSFIEEALEILPDQSDFLENNLATAMFFSGDYENAARLYEKAVSGDPDFAGYHRNLGDAVWQVEGPSAAKPIFETVVQLIESELQINPETTFQQELLVAYASLGRASDFERLKDRLISTQSQDPQIYYNIAVGASRLGEMEMAQEFARQAGERGYPTVFLRADPDITRSGITW